jgi:hypothetical protein
VRYLNRIIVFYVYIVFSLPRFWRQLIMIMVLVGLGMFLATVAVFALILFRDNLLLCFFRLLLCLYPFLLPYLRFPSDHFLRCKFLLLSQDLITLQSRIQKYTCRIKKELGSLRVMVTIECYHVFVTLVCLMKLLCMVWLYKIILRCS